MGQLALAAKITHVPSMVFSELDGPRKGTRQDAIGGHRAIGRRCCELGFDTLAVFDTHWLVNANHHLNCAPYFKGLYTSNELPHFIANLPYEFPGNPALGQLLARECNALGVETLAHDKTTLQAAIDEAGEPVFPLGGIRARLQCPCSKPACVTRSNSTRATVRGRTPSTRCSAGSTPSTRAIAPEAARAPAPARCASARPGSAAPLVRPLP